MAKQGKKTIWHFAHYEHPGNTFCVESAVHRAAKQILVDEKWLRIPGHHVRATRKAMNGTQYSRIKEMLESRVDFEYCREEVWESEVQVRPDVIGYSPTGRLLVEMFFTHAVDESKQRKLEALGLPTVEIDLSDLGKIINFEVLKKRVLHDLHKKRWVFNPWGIGASIELAAEFDCEIESINAELLNRKNKLEEEERINAELVKTIAIANEQFRLLDDTEKENRIRAILGFRGGWPRYLSVSIPEASAILVTPSLWQAGLFSKFVFKQPLEGWVHLDSINTWVGARFGLASGRALEARTAVLKYLHYLSACGFFEKSQSRKKFFKLTQNGFAPRPK